MEPFGLWKIHYLVNVLFYFSITMPHELQLALSIYYAICLIEIMFGHLFIYVNFELMKVKREKSIYHTLNMLSLDVTKKCLVGEGWSPVFATKQVISFPLVKSSLVVNIMSEYLQAKLEFICADSGCIGAGCIWLQFSSWSYFSGFAYERVSAYLFSHKQIYFCLSGDCWCIWVSFYLRLCCTCFAACELTHKNRKNSVLNSCYTALNLEFRIFWLTIYVIDS